MKPRKHIPDTILLNYVSGQLSPDFSYVINCHVNNCKTCTTRAARLLAIGGDTLGTLVPSQMDMPANDVLQSLKSVKKESPALQHDLAPLPDIPSKSELFDDKILRGLKYQALQTGVRQHILKIDHRKISPISARILWLDAGIAIPPHGHGGIELTQVLAGGFYDGNTEFTKGDIQVIQHHSRHQPQAMDDGPCIVLAAADTPLKFRNTLPKLLQPLFKI